MNVADRYTSLQCSARYLLVAGIGIGCLGLFTLAACTPPSAPPNLILVITDDQGYGDLGAHGNRVIQTPNLDALHAESFRLTDFHVDPTCSPTRSALMTGRYSTRTGVWHTIMGRSLMRTEEVTLAEVLAEAGYRTGHFGKWHLGDNYPLRPQDQGFADVFSHGGGGVGQTPDYFGNDYFDDTYFRNGVPELVEGYCTDVWFDEALSFIERHRDEPFFAYIATNAPHGPFLVDSSYSAPYEAQGLPANQAAFYGMITNIDENIGRLRAELDRLELSDNTILIFMTDNGSTFGMWAEDEDSFTGFNVGMRGRKGSAYEGGHRVPFFIRWPNGPFQAGVNLDVPSAHIDVLPTLADLMDLPLPDSVDLDGRSLAPLLRDETASWAPRPLFVHSQRIEYPEKWKTSSVMTGPHRLINGVELYDLSTDPGQTTDLATDHPALVDSLRALYETWWTSLTPSFDEYVTPELGSEAERPVHLTAHDWHAPAPQVPWNQTHIRNDLVGNGFWMVEVLREGAYQVTLRTRPRYAEAPLEAVQARLQIGDQTFEQSIPDGATHVTFEPTLPPGGTRLQTTLVSPDGTTRGAYFVDVDWVP